MYGSTTLNSLKNSTRFPTRNSSEHPHFVLACYIGLPVQTSGGSPHATPKKKDPWHASVALRRKEDFEGSGLSLHVYPDGTVVPSKEEFPVVATTAATEEEVGRENACWLDSDFIADWQASSPADSASPKIKDKGKGKAKDLSSRGSSSKHHKSSRKHDASSSSEVPGAAADFDRYTRDSDTGALYRYMENGAAVYLDPESQREYYFDAQGQAVWL